MGAFSSMFSSAGGAAGGAAGSAGSASGGSGGFAGMMGGMSSASSMNNIVENFGKGFEWGSAYATAEYNANAMKNAAESLENKANISNWLLQKQYASDYRSLVSQQERQMAMNQVVAAKRGITGDSANAVMQAYAMQGQLNLERLYYNLAMKTASTAGQYGAQINAYKEKERQYRWQGTALIVKGIADFALGSPKLQTDQQPRQETTMLDFNRNDYGDDIRDYGFSFSSGG
jgi:hypothetical protein